MAERTPEPGETEVRFLSKAPNALVAQWIVHTGSNGKVGGSTPPEGTRDKVIYGVARVGIFRLRSETEVVK